MFDKLVMKMYYCCIDEKNNTSHKIVDIIKSFKEKYDDFVTSAHCRASKEITNNIKQYFINELKTNLSRYSNKTFLELFSLVYNKLSQPAEEGGGKVKRSGQGGACGLSTLAMYDITIMLIRSIPSNELDDKVFLIKDKTKGPYNYVTKILRYDPKPYPGLPEDRNKIYFIGKDEAIKLINKAKYKLKTPKGSIEDFDSDNLESYMCECYKYYKDRV